MRRCVRTLKKHHHTLSMAVLFTLSICNARPAVRNRELQPAARQTHLPPVPDHSLLAARPFFVLPVQFLRFLGRFSLCKVAQGRFFPASCLRPGIRKRAFLHCNFTAFPCVLIRKIFFFTIPYRIAKHNDFCLCFLCDVPHRQACNQRDGAVSFRHASEKPSSYTKVYIVVGVCNISAPFLQFCPCSAL